jgi:hypothetical protein
VTISGERLAEMLAWLARTAPGCLTLENPAQGHTVYLQLTGLAELLHGLASTEHSFDVPPTLSMLADLTQDLAARVAAREDVSRGLKGATVTIGQPRTAPTEKAVA